MKKIEIDREKCIKCGACVKDCITYSIELDSEKFPKIAQEGENICIGCQHCLATCPTGAISFNDKNPLDASSVNYANPDDVLSLIKSRRSIRQYKAEEISQEDMDKLKAMLPYIPTGCNFNGLHFSFVETRTAMDKIREYTNKKILKLISNKFTAKYAGKFVRFKQAFEAGEDIIFRNAPQMVIVSSHIHAPCANVDPIIALSYIELYAQSLGIGTCWCGFAQACFKILPKLSSMVDIPDGYKPVYAMLLGYPSARYYRTTLPEAFPISQIYDIGESKISLGQKIRRILLNFIR